MTGVTSGVGTAYPFAAPEFTPGFEWGSCCSIFSFICMFCRSLFVLLSFFFWPLCCLFFFDIRIMIVPLISSNSSYHYYLIAISFLFIFPVIYKSSYINKANCTLCWQTPWPNSRYSLVSSLWRLVIPLHWLFWQNRVLHLDWA